MHYTPSESLERIVDAYRKGYVDKMNAINMVERLHSELCDPETTDLLRRMLLSLYRNSDMTSRQSGGNIVNEAAWALCCLADFYPPQKLPELVFSRPQEDDSEKMELWAHEILPQFQWTLMRRADQFDTEALNQVKAYTTLVRKSLKYRTSVLSAVEGLERTAEYIEFQRFAKTLSGGTVMQTEDVASFEEDLPLPSGLDARVASALKEAAKRLQSQGEFDAKTAADLLRSAMDHAHREIVKELERANGKPYDGGEKDGARRSYMRSVGFISIPEETFFSAIYALISQEGSHKLVTPRETVLLLHQTVSNYLRLLTERLNREVGRP